MYIVHVSEGEREREREWVCVVSPYFFTRRNGNVSTNRGNCLLVKILQHRYAYTQYIHVHILCVHNTCEHVLVYTRVSFGSNCRPRT